MDAPSSSSSLFLISSNLVVSATPPTSTSSHPKVADNRPLPFLPIELKREILRFCDPSTLATTSLVSLAFLEMSSPLLYHDVFIDDVHRLAGLFCQRDDLAEPQLESYLSLGQIKHFTYLPTRTVYTFVESVHVLQPVRLLEEEKLRGLQTDRFPPPPTPSFPRTLPLDTLTLQLRGKQGNLDCPEIFYSLFNPMACKIEGLGPESFPHILPHTRLPISDWSRLSLLTIENSDLSSTVRGISSLKPKLDIIHDLTDSTSNGTWSLSLCEVAQTLLGRWQDRHDRLVVVELPKVQVLVGTESQKARFLRELDTYI